MSVSERERISSNANSSKAQSMASFTSRQNDKEAPGRTDQTQPLFWSCAKKTREDSRKTDENVAAVFESVSSHRTRKLNVLETNDIDVITSCGMPCAYFRLCSCWADREGLDSAELCARRLVFRVGPFAFTM